MYIYIYRYMKTIEISRTVEGSFNLAEFESTNNIHITFPEIHSQINTRHIPPYISPSTIDGINDSLSRNIHSRVSRSKNSLKQREHAQTPCILLPLLIARKFASDRNGPECFHQDYSLVLARQKSCEYLFFFF